MRVNRGRFIYFIFALVIIVTQTGCFLNAKVSEFEQLLAKDTPDTQLPLPEITDPTNVQLKYVYASDTGITWNESVEPSTTYKIALSATSTPNANCESNVVSSGANPKIDFSSLTPDTTYYYRICSMVDGRASIGTTGSFKTLKLTSRSAAYAGFSNWNDYLKNNGTRLDNSPAPTVCATSDYPARACMNGGMIQKLTILGVSDCSRIKTSDHLGAFSWACATSGANAIVYSTDFNLNKGLKDLIANNQFIKNSVIVKIDGQATYASALESWWTNVIETLPTSSGSTTNLTNGGQTSGKIFTVSTTQSASGYSVTENKISIVVLKGGELINDLVSTTPLVAAAVGVNFLYFEGRFNGNNQSTNVFQFINSVHSRIHNFEVSNATSELVALNLSQAFKITDFTCHHGLYGISGNSSQPTLGSQVSNGMISNLTGTGLRYLSDSVAQNITMTGLMGSRGAIAYSNNSIYNNITIVNNSITNGVYDFSGGKNLYHNLLVVNAAGADTVYNYQSYGSVYSQIVLALGTAAEILNSTTRDHLKFTNNLVLQAASDCSIATNTAYSPGLVNGTCANDGLSNATLVLPTFDFTNMFVGKIQTQDSKNTSNTLGSSAYSSILDWGNFDNAYRAWGNEGSTFPATDNRGPCTTGTCRIWDYRLKASAANIAFNSTNSVSTKNAAFIAGSACPAATSVTTFTNSTPATFTFVTNAIEIPRDGIGNDNSLCESNEACLYTPNFGSYQGEGDYRLAGTCTYTDTTVTGVKLYAYPTNGL